MTSTYYKVMELRWEGEQMEIHSARMFLPEMCLLITGAMDIYLYLDAKSFNGLHIVFKFLWRFTVYDEPLIITNVNCVRFA